MDVGGGEVGVGGMGVGSAGVAEGSAPQAASATIVIEMATNRIRFTDFPFYANLVTSVF